MVSTGANEQETAKRPANTWMMLTNITQVQQKNAENKKCDSYRSRTHKPAINKKQKRLRPQQREAKGKNTANGKKGVQTECSRPLGGVWSG